MLNHQKCGKDPREKGGIPKRFRNITGERADEAQRTLRRVADESKAWTEKRC